MESDREETVDAQRATAPEFALAAASQQEATELLRQRLMRVAAETGATIGHNLHATIADMEKRMKEAAGNLEFEQAASTRDQLGRLRALTFGAASQDRP